MYNKYKYSLIIDKKVKKKKKKKINITSKYLLRKKNYIYFILFLILTMQK